MVTELLLALLLRTAKECEASKAKARPQLYVMIRELSGTPIAGVAVTLRAYKSGWTERVITDQTGDAVFTAPSSGKYRLNIECERLEVCSHVLPQGRHSISLKEGVMTSTSFSARPVVIF
jgi:hypothetical protein